MIKVVSITKKGQATIPKELRDKFGLKDKALVLETNEGILLKPLPTPEIEFGSLKELFKGKTSKEILEEARAIDILREERLQGKG
jgi:AbrB family looped-hinge helix DNA binding protein